MKINADKNVETMKGKKALTCSKRNGPRKLKMQPPIASAFLPWPSRF